MLVDIYKEFGPTVQDCGTKAVLTYQGKNYIVAELTLDGWLTTADGRRIAAETAAKEVSLDFEDGAPVPAHVTRTRKPKTPE